MRKNLVVGILSESYRDDERRAPLAPKDVRWLMKKGVKIEVISSKTRIFTDRQYEKAGARVLNRFKQASVLLGIKQPEIDSIQKDAVYLVFSHTIKGQPRNMTLLKQFIKKRVTLIDYEKIIDEQGQRLVYFGRFAGICGLIDSLCYFGRKLECRGIKNPLAEMKPAYDYVSFKQAVGMMRRVKKQIQRKGFQSRISPFIIGIMGSGRVSQGVQEVLKFLDPIDVHPKDLLRLLRDHRYKDNKIYKVNFLREQRLRSKNGGGFYFEEYFEYPHEFESNLDTYLQYINMLINASYWDSRYPRMVTKKMVKRLSRKKNFRLEFIGDIACDINGSIELTYKTTTQDNPVFTYDLKKRRFIDGYTHKGITVLAVDNLPAELPRDSSRHFSFLVRDYVYQISAHGMRDITNHTAIPKEIRQAVIAQGGKLTPQFNYLNRHLNYDLL